MLPNNVLQKATHYVIPEACVFNYICKTQKSRIQLYLQNATRYVMPPASAKRESRTSR